MRHSKDIEARHFDGEVIVTSGGVVHLSLTSDEFELLQSLDGQTTLEELNAKHGSDCSELLKDFESAGLLEGSEAPRERRIAVTENGIEFGGFDRLIEAVYRAGGRHLLGRTAVAVAMATIVTGLISLFVRGSQIARADSAEFNAATTLLVLSVLSFALAIVHESAHALVTHHYGRRVGRAGFGLYWGALTFFVDSTDAMLLPRRHRIIQAVAGPAVDTVAAALLTMFATWIVPPGPWKTLLLQLAVLVWLEVLMNLVPLLELDGYWALSDALDRPNLRRDSLAALRRMASGDATLPTLRLAGYGATSVMFGLAALATTVWAWIYFYMPLIRSAIGQGWVGILSIGIFAGPVVVGLVTAVGTSAMATARRLSAALPRISTAPRGR
jgi:putative peptide zinc metalloprotease protein